MSKDKRKRLSIYDLFGRSSSDHSAKSKPQKSRPKSLSAIKSTPIANQKNKHHLTFTLPDESITNLETSSIPVPKPRDKRSSLLFPKNSSASQSSNNSSQIRISSPVSPVVKNSIPMDQKQKTSTSQPSIQDRTISGASLTSSVYASSRNVSSSTIDFSRQTSSIYPPSTFAKDTKSTPVAKKRTDLMAKRKPPVSLSIQTESTKANTSAAVNQPESSPKMRPSAADSYESSEGEFTPLNLMPTLNDMPLSSSKQLNTTQNGIFENISGAEYEPPSFEETDKEKDNAHKHSRTLSSIEEITSALEKFQMEHEQSFQEMENYRNSYASNTTDDHHTIDMKLREDVDDFIEKEGIYLKVEDLPQLEEGEDLENYIEKLKASPAAHVVTETKGEGDHSYYSNLGKPGLTKVLSQVSSESDVFYDSNSRAETPKLAEEEVFQEGVLQPNDTTQLFHKETSFDESLKTPTEENEPNSNYRSRVETLTDEFNNEHFSSVQEADSTSLYKNPSTEAFEVPESLISDFNYDDLSLVNNEDEYSKEEDLIGPLNKSFDSYVAKARTRDSKISDTNSNSIVSGSLVEMDDGDWKRYDSATTTNFFHPPVSDELNNVVGLSMPQTDLNQYDNEVVTPTEQTQNELVNNQETPSRDLDLENELDDNFAGVPNLHNSDDSLNELYPHEISDDDIDEDEDEDDGKEVDSFGHNKAIRHAGGYEEGGDYSNDDGFSIDKRNEEGEGEDDHVHNAFFERYDEDISIGSNDEYGTESNGMLEFSPQTRFSADSPELMNTTPEIYKGGFVDRMQDTHITGTPTELHDKTAHHFVIANDTDDGIERIDNDSFWGDNDEIATNGKEEAKPEVDESMRKSTYDRRETPIVKPIEHSMVVAPAVPLHTSHTLKLRRPPPSFPSAGRRGRALSESTKDPELFMNGIKNQGKFTEGHNKQEQNASLSDNQNYADHIEAGTTEEGVARKGEKCTYIESLRGNGRRTVISKAPSSQIMPLSIKQNGTISHKKIPSVQLLSTYKSKHIVMTPKTRMLASEIDNGELPDATLVHSAQKTKVPIHPDADVIAASEQFNKLAKKRSGDLERNTSIMSVRPHYGAGMRLFVTNPDGDDD